MLTYYDLFLAASCAAVAGLGAGIPIGLALHNRIRRQERDEAPGPSECGSVCALGALPRDRVVLVRRERRASNPRESPGGA